MISDLNIYEIVDTTIKRVWIENIKNDYQNNFLLKEDSMKNAFYFHLRCRLGNDFLLRNNIRIFTEYFLDGERVDLVVAVINPEKSKENYLGDCVEKVIASVEMKYKGRYANENIFYKDVKKVLSYIEAGDESTRHYLAFIQEKYFKSEDIISWLSNEQIEDTNGQLVELYAYWDLDTDETNWTVTDHRIRLDN